MPDLIVIGSLNMDLVVRTPRFPAPGETIQGKDLADYPGGKGANQAVAASKQGLDVAMIGKVGQDPFGNDLLDELALQGVDTRAVRAVKEKTTGTAVILVNDLGENMIVLSPGANADLQPGDIDRSRELLEHAEVLLMQFESPMETVEHAAKTAKDLGLQVIVNPAPGRVIGAEFMRQIDILIPNESELSLISGKDIDPENLSTVKNAGRDLLELGLSALVVTLGSRGSLLITNSQEIHIPAPTVDVVDTTAAGDSFIGGFVSAHLRGQTLEECVRYANCAGALATTKPGAQPSLPTFDEVNALYQKEGHAS